MREKVSFQPGMIRWFEMISDRYISRRLYGQNTFNT
jgi:hypothetical protein